MAETKIEWATHVWNPVTGCTKVSEGCRNCYAETMARRFPKLYPDGFGKVTLHNERLEQPLHWRKPARIFVSSMGDLFHEDVPIPYIEMVLDVMAQANWHTFLVLTKRPLRMQTAIGTLILNPDTGRPFPNVWLGVSVENQATADERIPNLFQTPAAKRFISAEPLLGPVDLKNAFAFSSDSSSLDWVIVGGESGPKARPMHPDWARKVRDDCVAAGVAFFFKQVGEWSWDNHPAGVRQGVVSEDGWWQDGHGYVGYGRDHPNTVMLARVGKKAAGHLLDGREWREYPDA